MLIWSFCCNIIINYVTSYLVFLIWSLILPLLRMNLIILYQITGTHSKKLYVVSEIGTTLRCIEARYMVITLLIVQTYPDLKEIIIIRPEMAQLSWNPTGKFPHQIVQALAMEIFWALKQLKYVKKYNTIYNVEIINILI